MKVMRSAGSGSPISDRQSVETPDNWIIFPLQHQKVMIGIAGWILGSILGFSLFAFIAPIMIPHNYQIGIPAAIVSTLILAMVMYVGLGSLWAIFMDILRLREAKQHVIIITPDAFVKQEGKKI